MRIGTPELNYRDGHVTWSIPVQGLAGTPDVLWYEVPEDYAELLTGLADPAMIGLLLPAMHAGEPIEVTGPVTDELSYNLAHEYQYILKAMIGGLKEVALDTRSTVPAGDPAKGVGTGFSGGVDSYAVIAEHNYRALPEDLRLTHLAFFNVGSHDRGDLGRRRFYERYRVLAPVAEEIGLPFVPIDSNLDEFFNFGSFPQTHGPRNLSAAALLQRGIGRYYFASGFPYSHLGVRRTRDSSMTDPIALPLFTTRQFRPVFHGLEYTRVEKTRLIAEVPESYTSLNVCVFPVADGRNCSRCLKCLRTELTLEIAGRIEDYRQVFDLSLYHRLRRAYLDEVVTARRDVFAAEIRAEARRVGFQLPSYPVALPRRGARVVVRKTRTLARRIRHGLKQRPHPTDLTRS